MTKTDIRLIYLMIWLLAVAILFTNSRGFGFGGIVNVVLLPLVGMGLASIPAIAITFVLAVLLRRNYEEAKGFLLQMGPLAIGTVLLAIAFYMSNPAIKGTDTGFTLCISLPLLVVGAICYFFGGVGWLLLLITG